MAKPLKILLAIFGTVVLLLLALVIALPLLFDPNDYRAEIAAAVKKETGRDFALGEIRLAVFPWVKLELKEVSLGNAAGFGPEPMLTVRRAEVGVRLMPLLREKRIEASTVALEGAAMHLAVLADGRNNWQDLAPLPPADAPVQTPTLGERLRPLDIEGVTLSEVQLDYQDARSGQRIQLSELALKTGRLKGGDPFEVAGSFKAEVKAPVTTATAEFAATVTLDAASGDVLLTAPRFKLEAGQPGAQPLAVALALQTESLAYAEATQQLTAAQPLRLDLENLVLGSTEKPVLSAKGRLGTGLAADLAQRRHSLKGLNTELQLAGSALPGGKPTTLTLKTDLVADLAAQQATLTQLQLGVLGLQASAAQWQIAPLGGEARLKGDLTLATFSPRTLLAQLGIAVPATADAKVLQSASFSGQLTAGAKSAAIEALRLKLDDTTLSGELTVRDFASQAMSFALSADRLDADRYLPPPLLKTALAADATPATKADFNAVELPVAALNQLNAQGTLQLESLKLKNLKLAKVRLKLDGARGATHRQQLSASLYGGSADMNLSVAPGARHALRLALSGINAGPLLKDFLDSDKLSGRGSMTLDVTTAGATVGAVRRALDGTLNFNLVDGAVKGFNLGKVLRDGQALLAAQAPAASATPPSTDFAELRGAGVITNGVLRSDQLSAKNPLIRLEGAGEVDLVNETLNYLAKPTLVNTASGQGGKERADLSGIVVPIRISGAWAKPKVSVDWQAALKQQAVTELREKLGVSEETVREKREELRAKAKEEIGKGLLKLFGGSKAPPPAEPAPEAPPPTP